VSEGIELVRKKAAEGGGRHEAGTGMGKVFSGIFKRGKRNQGAMVGVNWQSVWGTETNNEGRMRGCFFSKNGI